jgi:chemotaxis protein methyltransferase WspC
MDPSGGGALKVMTRADPVREVEELLRRGIGLDARSVGRSMVAIAMQNRRRKRGVKSDTEYAILVASSPVEFQALVEEVVVPETWFFRDLESFSYLVKWAQQWLATHPRHVLRILSAPCASGEEPYTIAMTLLGAGISSERFSIKAIDVSEAALERARQAVYGRNSFRGESLDFRDTHFCKTGEKWRLNEAVARLVHFWKVNLVEPDGNPVGEKFDIIFCRNLLIYFDQESRARVMRGILNVLAPEGLLFLGHAEGGLAHEFGFEPVPAPMTFAFHKTPPCAANAPLQGPQPAFARLSRSFSAPPPQARPSEHPARLPVVVPPVTKPGPAKTLEVARRLADEGRLREAREVCNAALAANGSSAQAFYLLALIEEEDGNEANAAEYYRKVLYIEPDSEEAMLQLLLLEQKRGRAKTARQLEERVRRVRARKEEQQRR